MNATAKDLVVLCACKDGEFAVRGLLSRHKAIGIRPIDFKILRYSSEKDNGCLNKADEFLRTMTNQYNYALVLFDKDGCGREARNRVELEDDVRGKLSRSGWGERADVIVIEPELDIWVWSDSPKVDECLGWSGRSPEVRDWLKQNKRAFWHDNAPKPQRPKEAMEAALEEVHKPWSSSIFEKLGKTVSVERCVDPAFLKLKNKLQEWFPAEAEKS